MGCAKFCQSKLCATDTALLQTFCGCSSTRRRRCFLVLMPVTAPRLTSGRWASSFSSGSTAFHIFRRFLDRERRTKTSRRRSGTLGLTCGLNGSSTSWMIEKATTSSRSWFHMIEIKVRKGWSANRCLVQGLRSGLLKWSVAGGLVTHANDPDDIDLPAKERDEGTKTPTATSRPKSKPLPSKLSMSSAGADPEATILPGNMWGGTGSANLR